MLHKIIEKISLLYVVCFSLLLVTAALVNSALLSSNQRSAIIYMVNYQAEVPFVKRTLLPTISNLAVQVAPPAIQSYSAKLLQGYSSLPFVKDMQNYSRWSGDFRGVWSKPHDVFRITVVLLAMFVSLLVYALALRRGSNLFFPNQPYLPELTMVFGLLLAASLADYDAKLYDFPAMALSALGLLYMYQKRWRAYLAVFILACINKESTVLLTVVCGMYFWKSMPRREWLDVIGVQLVLWGIITATLYILFKDNAGAYLFHIWSLAAKEIMYFSLHNVVILVTLFWLIFSRWTEIPSLLRYAMVMFVGCAATYLLFGAYQEYRVFYDSLPVVALISSYSLYKAVMLPLHCRYSDQRSTADPE